jgi:hypothetical protein
MARPARTIVQRIPIVGEGNDALGYSYVVLSMDAAIAELGPARLNLPRHRALKEREQHVLRIERMLGWDEDVTGITDIQDRRLHADRIPYGGGA